MDISKLLIFAIPERENLERNLKQEVYFKEYRLGDRDHRDFCEAFIQEHKLDHKGRGQSHIDYATTFCENGILLGFNSGALVNEKYFCTMFLNENLSDFQISFLYSQKEIYEKKFHQQENLFSTLVYSTESLPYRSGYPNFRYLKIEAIIQRNPDVGNGQALLFQELERQCNKKISNYSQHEDNMLK